MRAGGDHSTAEQERLALYLLGALEGAERESFEEHLAVCWRCLDEASEVGPSISGLAGLDDADWPLPASVVPADGGPASHEHADDAGGEPDVGPVAGLRRADLPTAGSEPTSRRSSVRPPRTSRWGRVAPAAVSPQAPDGRPPSTPFVSRRRRLAISAAAVVVALVTAAGVVTTIERGDGGDRVLTASGEAPRYGASLSVSISTHDGGSSTIRITVTGLRQGIRYRLFAVTRDGATHVVRDWTASSGPQQVTAETSLPVDDLSFITVGLVDGAAIVTAPISRGPASPR